MQFKWETRESKSKMDLLAWSAAIDGLEILENPDKGTYRINWQ